MTIHWLDSEHPHTFWDNTLPPRLMIESGETVVFETLEGTGQITLETASEALAALQAERIHPLTGPVAVEGAQPGDTLEVEVVDLEHAGWGWNGVIPGFGLLADDFAEPYIHHYDLVGDECIFNDRIRLPFEPFCGVMGVAPEEPGRVNTAPPRRNGGNVDIRDLGVGARVFLPVLVDGALFSCGDCHSAQGDGEINGTGIETPMTVTLRFHLHTQTRTPELRFTTTSPLSRRDTAGWFVTIAHGPDLLANAKTAVRYLVDHLVHEHDLTREQAYCLCGATVDLRISEIVNEPNWIVSAYLPNAIFS
jgi:acetamidase/formamidase